MHIEITVYDSWRHCRVNIVLQQKNKGSQSFFSFQSFPTNFAVHMATGCWKRDVRKQCLLRELRKKAKDKQQGVSLATALYGQGEDKTNGY